jgi:nucleotide-binding universal stress UspA family protein
MSDTHAASDFRRILVALNAARESQAALEAAAKLALRSEAELIGLFVEDVDLLNLAALPFSCEALMLSHSGRLPDPEQIERELKSKAAVARRALAQTAAALHLDWSFRIARGRVEAELLAAALEADLVALGKGTWPLSGQVYLGRTGRAVAARNLRSVLFATTTTCPADASVAVVYDGSPKSDAALALTARLAERDGKPLVVFALGDSSAVFAQLETGVRNQFQSIGISSSIRCVRRSGLADLLQALQAAPVSLLVVAANALASDTNISLDILVERSACSVLLIRG